MNKLATREVDDIDKLPALSESDVEFIEGMEAAFLEMPQVDVDIEHLFHAGMYARTLRVPADTVVTGAVLKVATILVISGKCRFYLGNDMALRIDGTRVMPGSKGRKGLVYTDADTVFTMIYTSSAQTVADAESEFTNETDRLMRVDSAPKITGE